MDAKTERLEDLTRLLIKHNAAEVQHRIANSEQCPRFDCAKWLCNASQVYKYDENTKACNSMTPRHGHRSSHPFARLFKSSLAAHVAHMAHRALALGQEEARSSTLGCVQRAPQGDCNRTATESSVFDFQKATCI